MLTEELSPEVSNWKKSTAQNLSCCVVGFGKMGILHAGILNLLKKNLVKSVVDNGRLLTFGASKFIRSVRFYRNLEAMLRKENPDIVYVTTPSSSHYAVMDRLLGSDIKHIFVEKPPTVNSRELTLLIDKAGSNHSIMVGFQKRYALPFRHAKKLIDEKVIGEIVEGYSYIKSSDIITPSRRFDQIGKGVLLDLGIHLLDLLIWSLGVETVESSRQRSIYTKVDDYFEAKLRTAAGAKISVEITWSNRNYRLPETCIELKGSRGTMKVTEDYLQVETKEEHPLLNSQKKLVLYKPNYYGNILPVNLGDPEYTLENLHFLNCIHNQQEPLTSLRNTVKTMNLIEKLYKRSMGN